jgi:hypothetical protein
LHFLIIFSTFGANYKTPHTCLKAKRLKATVGNDNEPKLFPMFAKVKSSMFIDALQLQLTAIKGYHPLRGVLKDDTGSVCRTIERKVFRDKEELTWSGLNDLPYGRYTLELSHGEDEMKMHLVKRI